MPSRILTAAHLQKQSNNMPVTVKHQRYWLALFFLRPRRTAILFFPLLLLISSLEIRSQTQSSSLPTAAASTERKVQPEINVGEQTTKLLLADASTDNVIAGNPRSGSSNPSFLKRVVLFPLRLVRAIASSFGEGKKSATPNARSGEVVGSKIFVDEAAAKPPDETTSAEDLSGDAAAGVQTRIDNCDFNLSPTWKVANLSFNSLYSFTVNTKGEVIGIKKVRDDFIGEEAVRACLSRWKLDGFHENSRFSVYFVWKHGKGWVRQEISGPGFKRIMPMENSSIDQILDTKNQKKP